MERVDRLREDSGITVQGKAFILRQDTPKEGMPRQPRPGEVGDQLSEPLRSFAEEAGLVMRRSSWTPNTLYAMEATEYAQQQGQFDAFHLAAYKAYWEDGKDLGDLDVIREIALSCGLDWPELSRRLESGYHRGDILAQHQQALSLGVNAIPAFLVGNQFFMGAQKYEIFQLALAKARESARAEG